MLWRSCHERSSSWIELQLKGTQVHCDVSLEVCMSTGDRLLKYQPTDHAVGVWNFKFEKVAGTVSCNKERKGRKREREGEKREEESPMLYCLFHWLHCWTWYHQMAKAWFCQMATSNVMVDSCSCSWSLDLVLPNSNLTVCKHPPLRVWNLNYWTSFLWCGALLTTLCAFFARFES